MANVGPTEGPESPRGARNTLQDALRSAFAMFSLKDPSLLAFDHRRSDDNLQALFGIGQIPSDTQMRQILDPLDPEHLRPAFDDVFRQLQRGKALEPFAFYNGCYLPRTEYVYDPVGRVIETVEYAGESLDFDQRGPSRSDSISRFE